MGRTVSAGGSISSLASIRANRSPCVLSWSSIRSSREKSKRKFNTYIDSSPATRTLMIMMRAVFIGFSPFCLALRVLRCSAPKRLARLLLLSRLMTTFPSVGYTVIS